LRIALADCFRLLHPAAAPRRCDDADVDRVALCAASIAGDAPIKLQALRDSLAGARHASRRSNGSPPTVRYIWGRIEHFLILFPCRLCGRTIQAGRGSASMSPWTCRLRSPARAFEGARARRR
jgi:hypothetical protein